jgi:2,5-diketo-D-gluconate reductase B
MGDMQTVEAKGAKIPAVGLGTWQLNGAAGTRITEQALRLGYRHLDCALIYGNEKEIGEGLRASGVNRADVFITTKVPHTELAPSALERAVKQSLANLRVSDVNLLLVHWPNPQVPLAETMGAMSKMKKEGYARHIGVSNFTVELIEQAVKLSPEPIVTNQIEWHPYLDETKVKAACARHGIAVTAYCPIARGRTGGDETLASIGKRHGKSAAQVSLRWLVQQGAVVIPRTSKVERLSENMAIFDFALTDAEMAEVGALATSAGRVVSVGWAPRWD